MNLKNFKKLLLPTNQVKSLDELNQRHQKRMRLSVSLTITLSMLFITPIKLILNYQINLFDLFLIFLCLPFTIVILKPGNKKISAFYNYLLLTFGIVSPLLISYTHKGNTWIFMLWCFVFFDINKRSFGLTQALSILLYSTFIFTLSIVLHQPIPFLIKNIYIRSFVNFGIPVILFSCIQYLESLHETELENATRKHEEEQTLSKMAVSLNHEINNPLMIANGFLAQISKSQEYNHDKILKIQKSLARIDTIVKRINEETNFQTINYDQSGIKMFNLSSLHDSKAKGQTG